MVFNSLLLATYHTASERGLACFDLSANLRPDSWQLILHEVSAYQPKKMLLLSACHNKFQLTLSFERLNQD